jgi:general secretion pathway protein K
MTRGTRLGTHGAQQGFALVIVLWTVGIIALLVSALVVEAGRQARLTATLRGQATARAAADAALSAAILDVLRTGNAVSGPRQFGGSRIAVLLEDFSGRLNPNLASVVMIQALLSQLGVGAAPAAHLAAAIVDWRTPGLNPSPNGAKAPQYRAAGMAYGPPGRPYENLDELGFVIGMDRELLAAMKPHLTLWTTADPDPTFADAMVLAALRASGAPPVAAASTEARVIAITAIAGSPDAPTVTRRAVVRFGYSPDGRGWRILAWDDGERRP